jgi:hypothetical protein
MSQPTLTAAARRMIAEIQQRGQHPICFLMNQATIQAVIAENMLEVNKRRSALGKAWHWLWYRNTVPKLESLAGVPVFEAPHIPNGGIYLQSASNGPVPGAQPAMPQQPAHDQAQANANQTPEFWEKERVSAGAPASVEAPTLNDLSSGGGERPTASDILMRAMNDADKLAGIVVVRVWPNQSLDLCLNVDPYAAQGILQKAMLYLMHGGL